jgi:hypothetical protein
VDGYSDFNALHSGRHNEEVQLCEALFFFGTMLILASAGTWASAT